ncbi:peptidase [Evansella tamaricis]|uniref:Peptidase n=1 Tax=Evansella tamaricis TaxID=2069301 RepID=A0ABS6JCA0_9BACI|nr:peptidase [Evansella tamaricis]MBU9711301.1 peptidase [Evansella tamaricis]
MNNEKLLKDWMKKNEEQLCDLVSQMVQEPSTQLNELGIQHFVSQYLKELNYTVDMWEPGGEELTSHSAFISARESFVGSPNVVGVKKGTGGGHSLVLNGHIDVVPEGDLSNWTDDPYSGRVEDGKIYGRGSTDMKGGNAAMLFALKGIYELGIPIKGDIIYHSVIEEESGGAGTLAAILRGYTGDAAIIPEPTQLKIFPKQQGSMWFRLHVRGASAHGGTRYNGVSAIEKAQLVLTYLKELEVLRNERIVDPLYSKIPIPIPINVGVIEGGDWPSSVPDLVKIEGRLGVAPDESFEDAKGEFEDWIRRIGERDDWFIEKPVTYEWFGARWYPGSIETDHPLMNMLTKNYKEVVGESPKIGASPWGTDGGLLTEIGNTPSVVFGPGVTNMAHFANEFVEIEKVLQCSQIIGHTILEWCNLEKRGSYGE